MVEKRMPSLDKRTGIHNWTDREHTRPERVLTPTGNISFIEETTESELGRKS
jgi:hypothetical protein